MHQCSHLKLVYGVRNRCYSLCFSGEWRKCRSTSEKRERITLVLQGNLCKALLTNSSSVLHLAELASEDRCRSSGFLWSLFDFVKNDTYSIVLPIKLNVSNYFIPTSATLAPAPQRRTSWGRFTRVKKSQSEAKIQSNVQFTRGQIPIRRGRGGRRGRW